MSDLLVIDQLSAAYGQAIALEDVQLRIQPGELVALLGPNGAGKSTLLKIIAGASKPSTGNVSVVIYDTGLYVFRFLFLSL